MDTSAEVLAPDRDVIAARSLVAHATPTQRYALLAWAEEILSIRGSELPALTKARHAMAVSLRRDVLIPLLRQVPSELRNAGHKSKRFLWDERGWAARLAMVGITVATAGFGGQGAGIAALGRAVGVPLWVVLGAGGAFLGALVDELTDSAPSTTYEVIEVHRVPSRTHNE